MPPTVIRCAAPTRPTIRARVRAELLHLPPAYRPVGRQRRTAVRAVVFTSPAEPVEVADVDLDPPGPGEVRVEIAAAGVCHSDLHVRLGDWRPPAPLVMGHEGAGRVVEVGPGVTGLTEGDHVVLSWVAPCGQCRYCLAGREARCQVAAAVVGPGGVLSDGTSRLSAGGRRIAHYLGVSSFAEYAVVPASGAIKIRRD